MEGQRTKDKLAITTVKLMVDNQGQDQGQVNKFSVPSAKLKWSNFYNDLFSCCEMHNVTEVPFHCQ